MRCSLLGILALVSMNLVFTKPIGAERFVQVGKVNGEPTFLGQLGDEFSFDGERFASAPISGDCVQIYDRDAGGPWSWVQTAQVYPNETEDNDGPGFVSLGGDTLAMTLPKFNGINFIEIFDFDDNDTWNFAKRLEIPDPSDDAGFGAVAVDGDLLVGGAALDSAGEVWSGALHVYERDAGGVGHWGRVAKLKADLPFDNERLGVSVAIDDGVILAGAYRNSELAFESGAAYIFERNEFGEWIETAKLYPTNPQDEGWFGWRVALQGNTAVVAAELEGDGAVYVFERLDHGEPWLLTNRLTPSWWRDSLFGSGIAIDNGLLVVGAEDSHVGGATYVFEPREGLGWAQDARIVPFDGEERDRYGASVGVSGDTVLVGSPLHGDVGPFEGAVYVYQHKRSPKTAIAGDCTNGLTLSIEGISAGAGVSIFQGAAPGETQFPGVRCPELSLELQDGTQIAILPVDNTGEIIIELPPERLSCDGSYLQAVDLLTCGLGEAAQLPAAGRQPEK